MRYAELRRGVASALGQDHRYAHVVRVARLAERLAAAHGVSTAKARTAGMLHDLARLRSGPDLLAECEARGLPIDAHARANPVVLHAPLGAEWARERFGVTDDDVLDAIRKHTLADARMSPLDEIVYLADGLEPGRSYAERASLEALAFRDRTRAMRAVLRSTCAYLHDRNLEIAPATRGALERYREGEIAV